VTYNYGLMSNEAKERRLGQEATGISEVYRRACPECAKGLLRALFLGTGSYVLIAQHSLDMV
jgi:hypothetical protein